MLNSLGPPKQRRLVAHRALKSVRQEWAQGPNDLLAKLDTLWLELGDSYPEGQRIMDFVGALIPTIQKELLLLDPSQGSSLTDPNSPARLIRDRNRRDKPMIPKIGESKPDHSKSPTTSKGGTAKTLKRQKRSNTAQNWPEEPNKR
jgi:hypothetical protein